MNLKNSFNSTFGDGRLDNIMANADKAKQEITALLDKSELFNGNYDKDVINQIRSAFAKALTYDQYEVLSVLIGFRTPFLYQVIKDLIKDIESKYK